MITLEIISELLDGRIPKTDEEKTWIDKHNKGLEESRKKTEEYEQKEKIWVIEQEKLLRKYTPKDYWSDGFYRSEKFKQIEKVVEERVANEIRNNLKRFSTHCHSEIYFRRRKQQIIRKEYGYKWYDIVNLVPETYWREKQKISEKYKVANIDYIS